MPEYLNLTLVRHPTAKVSFLDNRRSWTKKGWDREDQLICVILDDSKPNARGNMWLVGISKADSSQWAEPLYLDDKNTILNGLKGYTEIPLPVGYNNNFRRM